jgi:hypothetical protein
MVRSFLIFAVSYMDPKKKSWSIFDIFLLAGFYKKVPIFL